MVMRPKYAQALFGGLLGMGMIAHAHAQTASQILPPSQWELRPRMESSRSSIALPEADSLQPPAGAEDLHVVLKDVVINVDNGDKNQAAPPEGDKAALLKALSGKRASVTDIFAAAQAYEQSFVRAGYPLMRVIVPAQNLQDGNDLTLLVINGYIEEIIAKGLPRSLQRRITRVMSPLVGKRSVTLGEIERRLLLAGDTPGASLRSTLSAGGVRGAAKITLEADKAKLVEGAASVTNNLTPQSGRWLGSASFGFNSVLGLGERIQFNMAGSPKEGRFGFFGDSPSVRMFGGAMIMPVGINGLAFHVDAQHSKALSRSGRNGFPVSQSQLEHVSFAWSYPLIRKRSLIMTKTMRFDINDERVLLAINKLPLSFDRMRVLRLASDTTWFTPWNGVLWGKATASFGLDAFGARSAKDASPLLPLSRQGADSRFQKLEASFGYSQVFAQKIGVDFSASGQTSFGRPVVNSEQMGLANSSALSTFYSGAIQGDTAGYARLELSAPMATQSNIGAMSFKPYIFAAGGIAKLEKPTILETDLIRAASYGVGFIWSLAPFDSQYRLNLSLEWGQQLRSDREGVDDRVNVEMKVSF